MEEAENRKSLRRLRLLIAAAAFAVIVVIGVVFGLLRGGGHLVTRERLDAAQKLWIERAPDNYNIEIQTNGPRAARYSVKVRGGEAVEATIDGRPIQSEHAVSTWSVPGMFGTIESDVESREAVAGGTADPDTPRVTIWGEFNAEYGYPQSYQRAQKSQNLKAGFEVVLFQPLDE